MICKIGHYSLENPASIYDEEALTALELAGRTARKVNEVICATNDVIKDTEEMIERMPDEVSKAVEKHIEDGAFDLLIDEHTKEITNQLSSFQSNTNDQIEQLNTRVDNLILSSGDSSPEVVDMRRGHDGTLYDTAGEAMREQFAGLYNTVDGAPLFALLDSMEAGNTIGNEGVFYPYENRCASQEYAVIDKPFYVIIRDGYNLAYSMYEEDGTHIMNSGWLSGCVEIPAGRVRITVRKSDDSAITLDEGCSALIRLNESQAMQGIALDIGKYPLATVMLGIGSYVAFDTQAQTVTVPRDTLLFTGYKSGPYSINTAGAVTIDYSGLETSAIKVMFNLDTNEFEVRPWNDNVAGNYVTFCLIRNGISNGYGYSVTIACPYSVDGKPYGVTPGESGSGAGESSGSASGEGCTCESSTRSFMRSICHRGYTPTAPENTLPAFKEARAHGFTIVEADVRLTSDNAPVVIHDETIDRTSDGSGTVSEMMRGALLAFDFSGDFYDTYGKVNILDVEDLLLWAFDSGMHVYLDLKTEFTTSNVVHLSNVIKNTNMANHVTFLSDSTTTLDTMKTTFPKARLGYIVSEPTADHVTTAGTFKTDTNEVFLDSGTEPTYAVWTKCRNAGIGLERWTVNTEDEIRNTLTYTSGITSDGLHAGKILSQNTRAPR